MECLSSEIFKNTAQTTKPINSWVSRNEFNIIPVASPLFPATLTQDYSFRVVSILQALIIYRAREELFRMNPVPVQFYTGIQNFHSVRTESVWNQNKYYNFLLNNW